MREAISGTWLFTIVIFFVLLFTAYLALSINYSKAYGVKNEIVEIIERRQGLWRSSHNDGSVDEILAYLRELGYRSSGTCPNNSSDDSEWIGYLADGSFYPATGDRNTKYLFCVKRITGMKESEKGELPYSAYFRIKVFFQLDLPIFGDAFNLTVTGDTATMSYPQSEV